MTWVSTRGTNLEENILSVTGPLSRKTPAARNPKQGLSCSPYPRTYCNNRHRGQYDIKYVVLTYQKPQPETASPVHVVLLHDPTNTDKSIEHEQEMRKKERMQEKKKNATIEQLY